MKKKKLIDWKIVLGGLCALTVIECFALSHGVDGALMTLIIGIIGLTIGVVLPNPIRSD